MGSTSSLRTESALSVFLLVYVWIWMKSQHLCIVFLIFFFNYLIILYFFLCMQIILFKRHYVLFKYCLQDSQLFYSEKILKIGHRLGLVACKVYWEYGLGLNFGWFIMPIEESTLALIIIILLNYSAHSSLYLEVTGFCFNI